MYGILLYDGVEPIDVGAAFGVLSMATRIAPGLAFAGIARRRGEVVCANGLRVLADHDYASAPDTLTDLIVTGGPGWTQAAEDPETLDFIRGTRARITSMCTGAMILSAAGRLADKRATTKREVFAGEASPLDSLKAGHAVAATLVDSGDVVTSGGVTLGLDAMFYCLARSHGETVATEVARVMEYSRALAVNRDALGYQCDGPSTSR